MTLPILVLVAVGIFEFGRAYQTWQILTNAAREGARLAVLPNTDTEAVRERVRTYMQNGQLPRSGEAVVDVNRAASISIGTGQAAASLVTVDYPFDFMVLPGVARMVAPSSSLEQSMTMRATALMRNEAQ